MKNKRWIKSALFVGIIMFAISASLSTISLAATSDSDAEFIRAAELGFGAYRENNPNITYAEFMDMLDTAVKLADQAIYPEWRECFPEARQSTKIINRGNAILGVFAAAETLGGDVYARNYEDIGDGAYSGEWEPNPFWGDVERVPIGFEGFTAGSGSGDFLNWASHYVTSRASIVTAKTIFQYTEGEKTIRADENLQYNEALVAALRFYESSITLTERIPTEQDVQILAEADKRRQAILHSETDISYTGTAYYVATHGNDKNDGNSPEKPWATLDRINKAKKQNRLKPGDAIFFNRGDLWRGYIDCAKGVTYSAYGSGEKPRIYGSLESGSDAAKWELWHDESGVKIWKFYREITEVGNIVFNDGESYALRAYAYFNGEEWVVSGDDQRPFSIINELKHDLQFYSTFNLSKTQYNKYIKQNMGGVGNPGVVWADSIDTTGELYLRCDNGNPGDLYDEIEFHTFPKGRNGYVGLVDPVGDNIIDNLCIKYSLRNGIAIYGEGDLNQNNDNNVIQNCEIAWTGGDQHDLNRPDGNVMVCGEGIVLKTDGNVFRNNYIHQAACAGLTSEFVSSEWIAGNVMSENNVIEGNLIERCQDTLWFWDNGYEGGDIIFWSNTKIIDNYVMYMGYGWSGDPIFMYPTNITNTYHKPGETWSFAIGGTSSGIRDMLVSSNVFYLSNGGYLIQTHDMHDDEHTVTFSGNTYVQNDNRDILPNRILADRLKVEEISQGLEQYLGDDTAIVLPNFP